MKGLEIAKDILGLDSGAATIYPCRGHWHSNQLNSLTREIQSFQELPFAKEQAGADALWRKHSFYHLLWRESVLTVCLASHSLVFLNLDEILRHCTKSYSIDRFGFPFCGLFPREELHWDSALAFVSRCVVYVPKWCSKNSFPSTLSAGYDIIITTFFTLKLQVLISSKMKIHFPHTIKMKNHKCTKCLASLPWHILWLF